MRIAWLSMLLSNMMKRSIYTVLAYSGTDSAFVIGLFG